MKRVLSCMVWIGWFTGLLQAEGNGGYAGAFLRIGLDARSVAMGNAQVATADHGFGFYYNPAALPFLKDFSANFSYSFLSLDRRFSYIGLATPLKPQAGLSLGWIYSGVGDIQGYDSRGIESDKISHGLHAIYFSFGLFIIPQKLAVGLNAKYVREDLSDPNFDYSGKGFGGDLGIFCKPLADLTLGYQVKDLNARLKSNTNKIFERGLDRDNEFPISQRIGFFYQSPLRWARVAYDFEWSTAGQEKNHIGLEFTVPGVAARCGYDTDHVTFGAGLHIDRYLKLKAKLDYAFITSIVDEGASHLFSWQLAF